MRTTRPRWAWWLMPIITATWEVEIHRIVFQGQPLQKVSKISSQTIKSWVWWQVLVCLPMQKYKQEDFWFRLA
jgi:hypothetical protein